MSIHKKKSVTILSSTTVRPKDETPNENLWLSRLDMIRRQPYSHTHVLFIYHPNKTQNIQAPLSTPFFDTDTLKKSLEKALVPFYTMAGRVKVNESNGRYEIDCNSEGAIFIEAETLCTLTDLGSEINPNNEIRKELFPTCDYSKGLSTIPLLMVQLTRFNCGGVCLGFSQHHHVADGSSHVLFINSWARLTKGLDIDVRPVHDRLKYVAPRDPPQFEFLDSNYTEGSLPPFNLFGVKESMTDGNFTLSEGQINILIQEAKRSQESPLSYMITTFTVLAAHVWRSACKARNLSHDQDVKLYIPVDGRSILRNPPIPLGYTGNTILCATCKAKAGDIMLKPLWYTASKVCAGITKMKESECFRSTIDYIETQPSLEPLIEGENISTCPNLSINSWTKMPICESDFGWGAPRFIRHGGIKYEGQSVILPSENHGNLLLCIKLFSVHMTSFERYMYEFE